MSQLKGLLALKGAAPLRTPKLGHPCASWGCPLHVAQCRSTPRPGWKDQKCLQTKLNAQTNIASHLKPVLGDGVPPTLGLPMPLLWDPVSAPRFCHSHTDWVPLVSDAHSVGAFWVYNLCFRE